jgi:hypothetical protein
MECLTTMRDWRMIVHLEFDVQVFQSLVHLLAGLIHLDHTFSI